MGRRSNEIKREVFHEMIGQNPPRVKHTRRKQGDKAAQKVLTGMALDEARRRGAKIPRD